MPVLATGHIKLRNNSGKTIWARAVFDSGAELNLITENLVKTLHLKWNRQPITFHGITGAEQVSKGTVNVQIKPWFNSEEKPLFKSFVVMRSIPVSQKIAFENNIKEFKNIVKADPHYNQPAKIELLIGIDTWAEIVQDQIVRSKRGLVAQKTKLGFVIFGAVADNKSEQHERAVTPTIAISAANNQQAELALDKFLERFWQIEEIAEVEEGEDDRAAEKIFTETTCRDCQGRYIVSLPLVEGTTGLGESRSIALQRFYQLERRLERDRDLREKYNEFMAEYLELNHMRLANEVEQNLEGYYIPHHPITKRFRVVFDASCATSNGQSVNDIQLAGPNRQEELDIIIMRFRTHKYVFTGDIKKMFRQILLQSAYVHYQKIFWRFDTNEPVQQYVLLTVTYGMKSSPFLALRTMLQLATDYENEYPLAAHATRYERYMDDYMTGAEDEEQLVALYHQLIEMLQKAQFELSKWKTNCSQLIELINADYTDHVIELSDEATSILGLKWQPSSDCFTFQVTDTWPQERHTTKRAALRAIARIYDPCGFLAPVIIRAKSFMQWLWKQKVQWDEDLNIDHNAFVQKWRRYYNSLQSLNELRIPRWMKRVRESRISLHGFADASEVGYGAVLYVRCETKEGVTITLLASKTRVAPVKPVTIPRLELNAALLLVNLKKRVQNQCNYRDVPCYLYTDSKVALCWINANPSSLKQYVASRVVKITQDTHPSDWQHVPTKQNPADMASRGLRADELMRNELWWNGPQFMVHSPEPPEKQSMELSQDDTGAVHKEQKATFVGSIGVKKNKCLLIEENPIIEHVSSFGKAMRITALVLKAVERFKGNQQAHPATQIGMLSARWLKEAVNYWIRYTQLKHFARELYCLEQKEQMSRKSSLTNLCPFLDTDKMLRVRGRISKAEISYDEKHPIIIPPHSVFGNSLLRSAHEETCHGGVQQMLHYVRAKYWLVGARRAATGIARSCNICKRYRSHPVEQLMGDLPKERTSKSRPFTNCGVDYFGPFKIKRFIGRTKSIDTGYGAVFVCMSTRMVHIETVSNLTTDRFLWALQRMASYYGMPTKMFSDNAKTFKGAASELTEIHMAWKSRDVEGHLNKTGTVWHFITPRAPFQGGLWEAAVKSTKKHMNRMLKGQLLTFEEYQTLFAKITAVLNSRPIAPIMDDPQELNYLTPAHAMIGERIVQPLAFDLSEIPSTRVKQHKILDKVQQEFWNSFRKDYLSTLQSRYKWNAIEQNLKTWAEYSKSIQEKTDWYETLSCALQRLS